MTPAQAAYYSKISTYGRWLRKNVKSDGYGDCEKIAKAMAAAFPELEVRKGLYRCYAWGERGHWWCRFRHEIEGVEDPWQIVDPTVGQFPSGWNKHRSAGRRPKHFPDGATSYEDLTNASDKELARMLPSGVCVNCGEPVFNEDTVCSATCGDSYMKYINSGGRL